MTRYPAREFLRKKCTYTHTSFPMGSPTRPQPHPLQPRWHAGILSGTQEVALHGSNSSVASWIFPPAFHTVLTPFQKYARRNPPYLCFCFCHFRYPPECVMKGTPAGVVPWAKAQHGPLARQTTSMMETRAPPGDREREGTMTTRNPSRTRRTPATRGRDGAHVAPVQNHQDLLGGCAADCAAQRGGKGRSRGWRCVRRCAGEKGAVLRFGPVVGCRRVFVIGLRCAVCCVPSSNGGVDV